MGSTALAVAFSPHELVAILNDFFAAVVDVVEQHRGCVNKFEGDAVLAIFGAPAPVADAAGDASAAARELNRRLNRPDADLKVGIGVSAGMAVAGNMGDPGRYEYTVIGDPVNEAARLSELANRLGGIAVSGAARGRAHESEAQRWHVIESKVLRGRNNSIDIAISV